MSSPSVYQYQAGGSLPVTAPSYVKRQADDELFQALLKGEFCYVLNARQMGKSSLRVRIMDRLQAQGMRTGTIDMTTIGSQQMTSEQWYASVLQSIVSSFRLKVNLRTWWRERSHLSPVKRFDDFFTAILLTEIQQPVVIFIDEIDSVLGLDFPIDDFFALIRACYNKRVEEPIYQRLTFTLLGVATPSDLIADKSRTPFNIGQAIDLQGFRLSEALPLLPGLQETVNQPEIMLRHIIEWTNGQPFLTQKLCQLVLNAWQNGTIAIPSGEEASWLENLVRSRLIDYWELQDEPEHLRTIAHRLLYDEQRAGRLLGLYQQILDVCSLPVPIDNSPEQTELLLSGLVVKEQGYLRVRNQIYAEVFNAVWVEQQLTNLRPYAVNLKAWLSSERLDESRLLKGQALRDAEVWAEGKRIGDRDYQFLAASHALEKREQQQALEAARTREIEARLVQEKKTARLQRYFLGIISLALIAVLGLGLTAFWQYRTAKVSEIQALSRSSEALFASDRRLDALIEALRAKQQLRRLSHVNAATIAQVEEVLRQAVYGAVEFNRLVGHQEYVYSVVFSPDGQQIATGSRDKTIKLWARDGRLLKTLNTSDWVFDVVFSPNGQFLAASTQAGEVKFWRRDGRLLWTWKQQPDLHKQILLFKLIFSPDGQSIAVTSDDRTVKLLDLNGRLVRSLKGHQDAIWSLDWSQDGQTIDLLQEVGKGKRLKGKEKITNLSPFPLLLFPTSARSLIASASEDRTVKLWSSDGSLIKTLVGHQGAVYVVRWSQDGQLLASGDMQGAIKLWHRDGRLMQTLAAHNTDIFGISFSPDGQLLVSASADQTVKVWRRDGTFLLTLKQGDAAWRVAFSPDGKQFASSGSNNLVKLWQLQNPALTRLLGHRAQVLQVAFSPDSDRVASASWDRTVKLWTRDGRLLTTFRGHNAIASGVAFHPDGQRLASSDGNGIIHLWQANGKQLKTFSLVQPTGTIEPNENGQPSAEASTVDFSPDGQLLAASNTTQNIARIWKLDGSLVTTLTGHQNAISHIRFSPDGRQIATSSYDGTIKLWHLDGSLIRTFTGHKAEVQDLAFSPDGKLIVSGSHDRTVKLWTVEGKLLRTFSGHSSKVYAIAFSPDGKTIASGSRDRTIKLWKSDGTLLATLKAHQDVIFGLAFSQDGRWLTSGSWDKSAIIWNLQQAIDINRVEQIGCDWVRDYLRTNPEAKQDAALCKK
ncbi:MAG: AAA-like domain-containing protein [Nostoc sp. DedVER02]|uniref:WD40 domain-containing protein n=1 Tax=unclassified Nostoc TaxID=2593658 RepID=UPI002AD47BF0|nr:MULTISPECIES: AAA-like domain-containing protein [unclassified Nostoc]MDZ7988962.1 AAA-like domain-containing protein [Nostoc sp. DedVER02]MDZ8114756.1 AAA-like domain-containing protein [Nostoc sp. DedVER01b]